MNVFGRRYELFVSFKSSLLRNHLEDGASVSDDYATISDKALKITNPIQMTASIEYGKPTNKGSKGEVEVKLHNLSEKTTSLFRAGATLLLRVGYEQDSILPIAFIGDIVSVRGEKGVTSILCKEGRNALSSTYVSVKIRKGQDALGYWVDKFSENGITPANIVSNNNDITEETYVANGKLEKVFSQWCREQGYEWQISNARLNVTPKYITLPEASSLPVYRVTSKNVIGVIAKSEEKSTKSGVSSSVGKLGGIKFKLLADATIRPESLIDIAEGDFKGFYKTKGLMFDLNWKGGDWCVEVLAEAITEPKNISSTAVNTQTIEDVEDNDGDIPDFLADDPLFLLEQSLGTVAVGTTTTALLPEYLIEEPDLDNPELEADVILSEQVPDEIIIP